MLAALPPMGRKLIETVTLSLWFLAFLSSLEPAPLSFKINLTAPAALAVALAAFRSLPEAETVPAPPP